MLLIIIPVAHTTVDPLAWNCHQQSLGWKLTALLPQFRRFSYLLVKALMPVEWCYTRIWLHYITIVSGVWLRKLSSCCYRTYISGTWIRWCNQCIHMLQNLIIAGNYIWVQIISPMTWHFLYRRGMRMCASLWRSGYTILFT